MLGGSVVQVPCDAPPLFVLGLEQPASHFPQGRFRLPPLVSIDEERDDQNKLRNDDRRDHNNAPPVLLPCRKRPIFNDTSSRQIVFREAPFLQLSPIEHIDTRT